jgi:hypothetical protein
VDALGVSLTSFSLFLCRSLAASTDPLVSCILHAKLTPTIHAPRIHVVCNVSACFRTNWREKRLLTKVFLSSFSLFTCSTCSCNKSHAAKFQRSTVRSGRKVVDRDSLVLAPVLICSLLAHFDFDFLDPGWPEDIKKNLNIPRNLIGSGVVGGKKFHIQ